MKNILQIFIILILLFFSFRGLSQSTEEPKIKLFVDCSNAYCDINFLKSQIKFVDFVLNEKVSDIHLLITQLRNGGGGNQYQLIFFGQNRFNENDTLHFSTKPNNTNFETRKILINYIQLGLIPFLNKTNTIENILISLQETDTNKINNTFSNDKDPWNYWVYRIGLNGNINGDANYKEFNYNSNVSVNRITEVSKIIFSADLGKNNNSYQFYNGTADTKIIVKNENYSFFHEFVNSISKHWSLGYDLGLSRNTFTNLALRSFIRPTIEFDIFPYKEVNTKLFTLRYGIDVAYNQYFDTTLYLKKHEALPGQQFDAYLSYNQKWGTINISTSYHSYFNHFNYYSVGIGGGVNLRISGGLSFNLNLFGNILRDQIYLVKGQITEQDILTRQRQLATAYSYYSSFGINYRFGSEFNNFINPRFSRRGR